MSSLFKVAITSAKPALRSELAELLGDTLVSVEAAPEATVFLIAPHEQEDQQTLTTGIARLAIVPSARAAEFTDALVGGQVHALLDPSEVHEGLLDACTRAWSHFQRQQANEVTSQAETLTHTTDKLLRQEEFVAIVSHELRSPLTSISGALDIALSDYAGRLNDKQRQYLSLARESCSALGHIVDGLLDVARSKGGGITLPASKTANASNPEPLSGEFDSGLAAAPRSGEKVLLVDADKHSSLILKGILMSAGHNVRMADTPDAALTEARVHSPILIVVSVGPGLPDPQSLLEILKHDADTRQIAVLTLAENTSEHLRHLCAHVLPLPIQPSSFHEACKRLIQEAVTDSGNKVLIVDDDPAIAAICAEVLRHAGMAVRIAEDGTAALAEARTFRPDLILLDVMMPDLDGFQTATKLKAEAGTAMTPIIFLSALGETSDKVKAFRLGAEDYVQKPFVAAELVARVRKALARRDRELSASPTTQLPGSGAIEREISARLGDANAAFCYLDLDNLKAYNDYYGYAKADSIIRQTGDLIRDVIAQVGTSNDFIGHIAGDDFVFVTTLERVDDVCTRLCSAFDQLIPMYYDKADRDLGFIETLDRYDTMRRFPLMTVSVATITASTQNISTYTKLSTAAAVGKQLAKAIQGSSYVRDGISRPTGA